jgi:transglutaminase-like putative cysteine protease
MGVGAGLQRTQLALQEWGIDALSDTDPDPYHSQTRIGDLGRVKRSERILWRVEQAPPAVAPLLLRNGVFSRYANGAWLARRDSFTPLPPAPASGQAWLTLHGQSRQGIAIVPIPIGAEPVGNERAMLQRNAYGIIRAEAAPPLLDVVVARALLAASTQPEAADLSLPPAFAELLQRLPALAALAPGSAQERLTGLQDWFAGHFRYTLFLGDEQRGGRDLERFLLSDRAGHCEYFASATVLLLRALGIPARYVTGYSVQEYSRLEAAFVVRQRHAHAWAEGFVDGRWVEVDTTPSTWLTVEEDAAPFWRPLADLLSFAWRRFAEWRRDVAASEFPVTTLALVAPLAALLAWLVLRRARPRRKSGGAGTGDAPEDLSSAEMRSFRALEQEFALLGFGRHLGEPPRAWLARLDREGRPVLGGPRLTAAGELIEALYRERYGPRVTTHSPPAPESANPIDAGSIRVKKTPPRRGQQNKRGNPE